MSTAGAPLAKLSLASAAQGQQSTAEKNIEGLPQANPLLNSDSVEPPKNVTLEKQGSSLEVRWEKSNTPLVTYNVKIFNTDNAAVYSVDNLPTDSTFHTFSNVRTNNYSRATVYAVLNEEVGEATSSNGVYSQLFVRQKSVQFTDINKLTEESKNDIKWAYIYGITTGFTSKLYRPTQNIKRGEMAAFLYRLAGQPAIDKKWKTPFQDINKYPLKDEIVWLYNSKITIGTDSTHFSPKQSVTRGQMALFLYRFAGEPALETSTTTFTDLGTKNTEIENAILWIQSKDITTGTDPNHFSPTEKVSRNQMAVFVKRYSDIMELTPFMKTENSLSGYFFGTSILRSDITSLEILDYIPKCENPVDVTDSKLEPGAVWACVYGSDVQIGQIGGVIANPDNSSYMFNRLTQPNLVLNIEKYDAFNSENMRNYFVNIQVQNLVLPTGFGVRAKEIAYMFQYATISGEFSMPDRFGKNATNASYMFEYATINIMPSFPVGFGEKIMGSGAEFFGCYLKTLNSGFSLPDNFASRIGVNSNYVFSDAQISGDVIIGDRVFENGGNRSNSLFQDAIIKGSIKFGKDCFKNAVSVSDAFRNLSLEGDLILGENFAKNTNDYGYLFNKAKIAGRLILSPTFGENITKAVSMFVNAQLTDEFELPAGFGAKLLDAANMFQGYNFPKDFKFPDHFGENITTFRLMFSDAIFNSDIDWSGTNFSDKVISAVNNNMFTGAKWNGFYLLTSNEESVTFLTTNTDATKDNVKVKG
ncbi:MAG: S-layer homology domain-containing protein [Bifidobacteriaceae bacterium]|nr:S-layer homology domain-containing protein [Bifidobacteriaceae bacterium]